MKIQIYLLLFFITSQSNDVVGSYIMEDDLFTYSLVISANHTFTLSNRGDSCWLWSDDSGTWKIKDNVLILEEVSTYTEYTSEFKENPKTSIIHKFLIRKNKLVSIESEYLSLDKKYKKHKKISLKN